MTITLGAWLLSSIITASGATLEVDARVGGRTAPESALEGPEHYDEVEPASLGAVDVRLSKAWEGGAGAGLYTSAWGYVPEGEVSVFRVEPWLTYYGTRHDTYHPSAAARYRVESLPWFNAASSGRGEVFIGLHRDGRRRVSSVAFQGIDRRYLESSALSFRCGALVAEVGILPRAARPQLTAWASLQVNQSLSPASLNAPGWQNRVGIHGSIPWPKGSLGFSYRYYQATGGDDETVVRRQFDLFGDYADDADALSVDGFAQHRVQLNAHAFLGPWTVQVLGMSRARSGEGGQSTFALTLHGHGSVTRQLQRGWDAKAALGVSDVNYSDGSGFTDVYGWLGLGRAFTLGGQTVD